MDYSSFLLDICSLNEEFGQYCFTVGQSILQEETLHSPYFQRCESPPRKLQNKTAIKHCSLIRFNNIVMPWEFSRIYGTEHCIPESNWYCIFYTVRIINILWHWAFICYAVRIVHIALSLHLASPELMHMSPLNFTAMTRRRTPISVLEKTFTSSTHVIWLNIQRTRGKPWSNSLRMRSVLRGFNAMQNERVVYKSSWNIPRSIETDLIASSPSQYFNIYR